MQSSPQNKMHLRYKYHPARPAALLVEGANIAEGESPQSTPGRDSELRGLSEKCAHWAFLCPIPMANKAAHKLHKKRTLNLEQDNFVFEHPMSSTLSLR